MQFRFNFDTIQMLLFGSVLGQNLDFYGWLGWVGGWVGGLEEKWSLKLPQPSLVLVEVEAVLGNFVRNALVFSFKSIQVTSTASINFKLNPI